MGEWTFEHSVQAHVTPEVAWAFWTDVRNWRFDPSLESVELDGPFAAGARGVTKPRGGEPIEWSIREAAPGTVPGRRGVAACPRNTRRHAQARRSHGAPRGVVSAERGPPRAAVPPNLPRSSWAGRSPTPRSRAPRPGGPGSPGRGRWPPPPPGGR